MMIEDSHSVENHEPWRIAPPTRCSVRGKSTDTCWNTAHENAGCCCVATQRNPEWVWARSTSCIN